MSTSTNTEPLDPAVSDHLYWLFKEIQVTFANVSALSVADAVEARAAIHAIAELQAKVARYKRASAALRRLLPVGPPERMLQ